jgi:hypothetical protein
MEIVVWLVQKFIGSVVLAVCSALGLLVYVPALVGFFDWAGGRGAPGPMLTPVPLTVLADIGSFFKWRGIQDVAEGVAAYVSDADIAAFFYWASLSVIAIGVIAYTAIRATSRSRVELPLMLPLVAIATLAQLGAAVVLSTLIYVAFVLMMAIVAGLTRAGRASSWNDQPGAIIAIGEVAAWSRNLLADFGLALILAPSLFVIFGFVPGNRNL